MRRIPQIVEQRRRLFLALANMAAALAFPAPGDFRAKVIRIKDGDTIDVMHNGHPQRIRLAGINAPERKQAFGSRARELIGQQVFGRTVTVRSSGIDPYRRTLGEVILPGRAQSESGVGGERLCVALQTLLG